MTLLTPGAQARVYKRGMLHTAVIVPDGRMEMRGLAPGEWELRCEGPDGEPVSVLILVDAFSEVVVVQVPPGADDGPVSAADTGAVVLEPEAVNEHPAADFKAVAAPLAPGEHTGDVQLQPAPWPEAVVAPDAGELDGLTVAELRDEARRLEVSQQGTKAELLERVYAARILPLQAEA